MRMEVSSVEEEVAAATPVAGNTCTLKTVEHIGA